MKKKLWFYIFVALQSLFLLLMAAGYYAMDEVGETIKLRTEPIDPRDPFYGDYLVLNYEVENIPFSKWTGKKEAKSGDKVYLLLEKGRDGVEQLVRASARTLKAESEEQTVMEARMEWRDSYNQTIRVDLGINRYYVEENTGREWEGMDDRLVTIVLAPWGQKKIQSIE